MPPRISPQHEIMRLDAQRMADGYVALAGANPDPTVKLAMLRMALDDVRRLSKVAPRVWWERCDTTLKQRIEEVEAEIIRLRAPAVEGRPDEDRQDQP